MLKSFSTWLDKHIGKKQLIALLLLYIVILSVMTFLLIPAICKNTEEMGIFDLQTKGYSLEYARSFITAMGSSGKNIYLKVQLPLDFLFPAVYTLLYFALAQKFFKKQHILVFGATALLCVSDYVENSLTYAMLVSNKLSAQLVAAASFFTVLKTIMLYITTGIIVAGGLYQLLNRIKKPATAFEPQAEKRQHKSKGIEP